MNIGVCGAAGRMGRRIIALGHEHPQMQISGAFERVGHPDIGKDAGELAGVGKIGVPLADDISAVLGGCDVLVDFSDPAASVANIAKAAAMHKAIVVGTTGFTAEQTAEIRRTGSATRCLIAPNMSLGVNLLFDLVARAARMLGDSYHVEIIEAHHSLKKDSPSGTANKLAAVAAEALGRDLDRDGVYGRKGIVGPRQQNEIGVFAVRGGDIVGEHTVMFVTNGERLELTHRAHSRDALAKGAVAAAVWLYAQPDGIYDMQDMLGIKAR
ncbi:MAG: 4-hydroxy-tetrahydrodipicolinate reductase [Thermodesulfobacteriota bacterium]